MENRPYNFSAGPGVLPLSVLETAKSEMTNWHGSGMSVMEMSHRGKEFLEIFNDAKSRLISLLNIPDTHEVLFMQGGATAQFASVPLNLLGDKKSADYAVTGNFSGLSAKEAKKYGEINIVADLKSENYNRIPRSDELNISENAAYFHYCANNTIYGTAWDYIPETKSVLVCDMSSEMLSKPIDVSKYGLIYAGAQKNMAPAGLTIVIIDKSLLGHEMPITPQVMSYKKMAEKDSMLNTPPCWCIYMLGLVLKWVEENGGVSAMEKLKRERSSIVYKALDESKIFTAPVEKSSRSDMNVRFYTGNDDLDKKFIDGAKMRGLLSVKGHRLTGGMRASLYNAMPIEGAIKLAEYIKEFEVEENA